MEIVIIDVNLKCKIWHVDLCIDIMIFETEILLISKSVVFHVDFSELGKNYIGNQLWIHFRLIADCKLGKIKLIFLNEEKTGTYWYKRGKNVVFDKCTSIPFCSEYNQKIQMKI